MIETDAQARDVTAFRRSYDLPTQSDYLSMLSSPDQEQAGLDLARREQAAIARMRDEGFSGSTLSEAYDWWAGRAPACATGSCGCGGAVCH